MSEVPKNPTEAHKKAAEFLKRPKPGFEPVWQDEQQEKILESAKIGDKMPDGTIYAGISPDTNQRMYTSVTDTPSIMTVESAEKLVGQFFKTSEHHDWRLPTKNELSVLFNNRAAIGNFDLTGEIPRSWYWSSTPDEGDCGWAQQFNDGKQFSVSRKNYAMIRYIRTGS